MKVVAAAIVDDQQRPTRVLAARRRGPAEVAGCYELPGGKIEPGESPAAGLRRELREELGIEVSTGPPVPGPVGGWWPLKQGLMLVLVATTADPIAACGPAHDDLRWVALSEAAELQWVPADLPVVTALARPGRPPERPASQGRLDDAGTSI